MKQVNLTLPRTHKDDFGKDTFPFQRGVGLIFKNINIIKQDFQDPLEKDDKKRKHHHTLETFLFNLFCAYLHWKATNK